MLDAIALAIEFDDDRVVDEAIERILRHLGLWEQGVRVLPARAPPEIVDRAIEPCFDLSRRSLAKADDPFPD